MMATKPSVVRRPSPPTFEHPRQTGKAASKRGQSDACIDYAEREQARPTGQRPKPRGKNNEHRFHGLYGKADSNVGLYFFEHELHELNEWR